MRTTLYFASLFWAFMEGLETSRGSYEISWFVHARLRKRRATISRTKCFEFLIPTSLSWIRTSSLLGGNAFPRSLSQDALGFVWNNCGKDSPHMSTAYAAGRPEKTCSLKRWVKCGCWQRFISLKTITDGSLSKNRRCWPANYEAEKDVTTLTCDEILRGCVVYSKYQHSYENV